MGLDNHTPWGPEMAKRFGQLERNVQNLQSEWHGLRQEWNDMRRDIRELRGQVMTGFVAIIAAIITAGALSGLHL